MKNIFKAFLLMITLIGIAKVDAETYKGKLYEEYHPNSGFTVFAAESNGFMDYNSWMIKSTSDNRIYYCIDPAIALEGSSEGSHNYIVGRENIIGEAKLTADKYKKVQLLAYYGYGYKDNNVDHTNKKWYGITQVMIWRVMRPDLTWTFKDGRAGMPNSSLFNNEVSEMNNLVNNHNKYPSFKDKTIKLLVGQTLEIEDANKVISNYNVKTKTNNLKLTTTGNKIKLSSDTIHSEKVTFEKSSVTKEDFALLTSLDYQDLIAMGAPDVESFSFNIEVTGGVIELQKVDKDTEKAKAKGEATLKGAVYEVYDSSNKVVGNIITDDNGKGSISLDYGVYTIKEKTAPKGYKLSLDTYKVELTKENDHVSVTVSDKVITGKVKLTKTKGGAGEDQTLENNAVFDVIDKSGSLVEKLTTNDKGMSIIELPYGTYTIRQTAGAVGYAFIDDITISLTEDKIYEIDLQNLKLSKLEFSKTDYSTDKPVPNTLIEIYKDDDTLVYSGRTDTNGKIILPGLEIGRYYILEKDAPSIYHLNEEKMYFEVKQNGEIIKANMKNYRKEGLLKLIKKDSISNRNLPNTEIEIKFMETNKRIYKGLTDENGQINLTKLVVGEYCIYETKAPSGYSINKEPICFTLSQEKELATIIMEDDKEIEVPDTSAYKIIPIVGLILLLSGVSLMVYEKKH